MMKYQINLELDIASMAKPVAEIEDSINESMRRFGYDDPIAIRTTVPIVMTTTCPMTDSQLAVVKAMTEDSFASQRGKVVDIKPMPSEAVDAEAGELTATKG